MKTRRKLQHSKNLSRQGLPRFFTKQLLAFLLLAFAIIVLDFFLYTFIALYESQESFNNGTPGTLARTVDSGLRATQTSFELSSEATDALANQHAWVLLLDAEGNALWEYSVPAEVPRSYTSSSLAMASHYGNIANYPTFFWDRTDELLVVGFPQGTYWHMALTFPESSIRNLPSYILLIFAVDLGVLFAAFFASRRRTQRSVAPIVNSLDNLSKGKPATLELKGDLREIGEKITNTSSIIDRKDTARANWIRGVSHDIRTPLSMILGYADTLAQDSTASESTRNQAAVIRTQGLKIKELVADLNATSQLDYDMQPLNLERIYLPRLLRTLVTEQENSGLNEAFPLELLVQDNATDSVIIGDKRLLSRAIENVLSNARLHNEHGCSIRLSLSISAEKRCEKATADDDPGFLGNALISISDDGVGLTATNRSELESRLFRARSKNQSAHTLPSAEHGLGLVLVDRIARAHSGVLSIEDAKPSGLTVCLHIPLAS